MNDVSHPIAAPEATVPVPAPTQDTPLVKPPKTKGERYYDRMQLLTGEAFIIAATAVIAYVARYGPDSYGKVPNYLKKIQTGFEKFLLENPVLPLGKQGEFGGRLAGAAASTTLTMWGGNLFAPLMKHLENNKQQIVDRYNEKHGAPGELEAGRERLKDTPKQSWGDVIKGRAVGWVAIFASFMAVDTLLGKSKKPMLDAGGGKHFMYQLDRYEEKVGRMVAGLTESGKAIGGTKMTQLLDDAQKANKPYRLGKIIALDLYATTAGILIWNVVSRFSAKKRAGGQGAESASTPVKTTDAGGTATLPKVEERPAPETGQAPQATLLPHTVRNDATLAPAPEVQNAV